MFPLNIEKYALPIDTHTWMNDHIYILTVQISNNM